MTGSASRIFFAFLMASLLGACASTGRGVADGRASTVAAAPAASGKPAPAAAAAPASPVPPVLAPVLAPVEAPVEAPVADAVRAGDSIYFAAAAKTLDKRDKDLLRRHAARLKENPRLVLTLVAHTPGQGSHSYNLALAGDWLDAVSKSLRAAGAPRKQLRREHARRPRETCTTNACRQELRRVDLVYR